MVKYKLTPKAKEDIKNIWYYTDSEWGTNQADEYIKAIAAILESLSQEQETGRVRDDVRKGYRSFVAKKHIIFYRKRDGIIEVVRILHYSMDVNLHIE